MKDSNNHFANIDHLNIKGKHIATNRLAELILNSNTLLGKCVRKPTCSKSG